ncbi:hypothetical protein [Bacillus sp. AFS015802]|uniref:hypothetical protein n=1 Tax=Bacillus sp. AFS015802 TaxID=2033486 RepID=UPI0015CF6AC0|nr:hypothetical protein [Bacillus sp. AFS015802]
MINRKAEDKPAAKAFIACAAGFYHKRASMPNGRIIKKGINCITLVSDDFFI